MFLFIASYLSSSVGKLVDLTRQEFESEDDFEKYLLSQVKRNNFNQLRERFYRATSQTFDSVCRVRKSFGTTIEFFC